MTSIRVDVDDPTPPYEQIRRQLTALIGAGELPPGTRLPPVRQLAGDLRVAPGTVVRAYRELADAGWVEKRRGVETRVAAHPPTAPPASGDALHGLTRTYVAQARALGCADDAVLAAVERALRQR